MVASVVGLGAPYWGRLVDQGPVVGGAGHEGAVRLDSIYGSRRGVGEGNASSRTNGGTESVAGVRPSGVELVQNPILARPR